MKKKYYKCITNLMSNIKKNIILIILFLILFLIDITWIISYYFSIPVPILINKEIWVNFYRFLLIFTVMFGTLVYMKRRSKQPSYEKTNRFFNALEYFILPFYQFRNQFIKVVWLFISLLVIPLLIIFLYNDFCFPEWTKLLPNGELNEPVFWGFWFSILGIIFTVRIYLEFVDKRKHSLGEFLMLVNSFFDKTNNKDEIKILMPTLYIGALTEKNFFRDYENKLLHICRNNTTTLSFLNYGNALENISFEMDCKSFDTLDSDIDKYPLFKFHNHWFPRKTPEKYAIRKKYYEEMLLFLSRIQETNANVNLIDYGYFFLKEDNNNAGGNGNEDLFMFINVTKGIIYIGHMKIMSQTSLCFEASQIENVHLANYFSELYDKFIENKCKKDKS